MAEAQTPNRQETHAHWFTSCAYSMARFARGLSSARRRLKRWAAHQRIIDQIMAENAAILRGEEPDAPDNQ